MSFRVLVCGGRDYDDVTHLHDVLNAVHAAYPIGVLISGMATGADADAAEWAKDLAIALEPYPADWYAHGSAAGPIRNQRMLDEGQPDLVIAFPGGKGTADMCARAKRYGVKVVKMRS